MLRVIDIPGPIVTRPSTAHTSGKISTKGPLPSGLGKLYTIASDSAGMCRRHGAMRKILPTEFAHTRGRHMSCMTARRKAEAAGRHSTRSAFAAQHQTSVCGTAPDQRLRNQLQLQRKAGRPLPLHKRRLYGP
eukprot:353200-Chlamydomonas_euryale.AAC.13